MRHSYLSNGAGLPIYMMSRSRSDVGSVILDLCGFSDLSRDQTTLARILPRPAVLMDADLAVDVGHMPPDVVHVFDQLASDLVVVRIHSALVGWLDIRELADGLLENLGPVCPARRDLELLNRKGEDGDGGNHARVEMGLLHLWTEGAQPRAEVKMRDRDMALTLRMPVIGNDLASVFIL